MKRMAYLLVLPSLVFFLAFPAAATYLVGHLSLLKTDYVSTQFVGVLNYVTILSDVRFWRAMANGLLYCAMITPMMLVALVTTSLLAADFSTKVQNAVKFAVYIPVLASGVIIANVWKWIYAKEGLANWVLSVLGLGALPWLNDAMLAKFSVSVMFVATVMGGYLIVMLASIVSIPKQLLEAARIDGANGLQVKFRIILPIVMPTVALCAMLLFISAMQMWEFVFQLTSGGPSGGTATPVFDIYETAFTYGKYGLASAKALVLMVVIFLMVWAQKRIERIGQ